MQQRTRAMQKTSFLKRISFRKAAFAFNTFQNCFSMGTLRPDRTDRAGSRGNWRGKKDPS